jgi:hypothetical protein
VILDFVLLADAADVADGKLYVNGGAVTRLNIPEFPFVAPPLAVVIRFVLEPGDVDRERVIGVRWEQEGRVAIAAHGPIRPKSPLPIVEGEEQAAIIVAGFNGLRFEAPGLYEIVVTLDDEIVARKPLPVVRAETPPPA